MFNTLGDVCLFVRNGFPYKPSENGLPVTRIETISSGVINFAKVGFAEPDSKINQFKMEPGDILFSNINSPSHLGKVAFYDEVDELYHGMNLLCLRIKKDIAEPKYIYYLLDSSFGKRMSAIYGKVAINQSSISSSDVKAYKLKLPPLEKQREIAATLSTWDRAIELHDKLIALKEKQKQGLMQVLLTGKKRLLDDNGVPFSEVWETHLLANVGDIGSGGTPSSGNPKFWDGGVLWATPTDITKRDSKLITETERTISEAGLKSSSAKLNPVGTLLLCSRATIGAMCIAGKPMATNQGFKNIVPNDHFDVEFLYYMLSTMKHEMLKRSSGSTFLEISKSELEKISISSPGKKEQLKISSVLSSADNEIESIKRKRDLLKQQKQGLMQQLLG